MKKSFFIIYKLHVYLQATIYIFMDTKYIQN